MCRCRSVEDKDESWNEAEYVVYSKCRLRDVLVVVVVVVVAVVILGRLQSLQRRHLLLN